MYLYVCLLFNGCMRSCDLVLIRVFYCGVGFLCECMVGGIKEFGDGAVVGVFFYV